MPSTPKKRPTEIIELTYPVSINGTAVEELSMRRPTVRDQILFEDGKGSEARKIVKMLANLCEVSEDTIMDLDQVDFLKISEVLSGFQEPQSKN